MNKSVYPGFYILDLSKINMCDFQYDQITEKYGNKEKLYYIDTIL